MRLLDISKLQDVSTGAQYLLGCVIVRKLPSGKILSVKIVETESYHQEDPASHTFRGETTRNKAMFGPAGYAYVYFTYGIHWCLNVTAGPNEYGAGILIRAAEPLEGLEAMYKNRFGHSELFSKSSGKLKQILNQVQNDKIRNITNGPAKLAQALAIDKSLYGHDLIKPPLQIFDSETRDFKIIETTRVGISQAVNTIARYYIKDNPFVSKK